MSKDIDEMKVKHTLMNTSIETGLDIGEIFKNHIKIEPKVMAIETLFNNPRRFDRTNYKPPYQRNYVWDDIKASYFIESILLGTEIPPLIFFNSGDLIEVIDGRQRYETIFRFVNNDFKLKAGGLLILKDLANKNFTALKELKDTIWDTKLRIIEFSFHSKPLTDYDVEDLVKKEIFKRYNTGITPLKPTEIDKAKYIEDDLNGYIKKVLKKDVRLYDTIKQIFYTESENIETLLKKIRQLLVLHNIPISYYTIKKDEIVTKFYELLAEQIENEEDIIKQFELFIKKVNFLASIKKLLDKSQIPSNRLVYECLYWALSVLQNENVDFSTIDNSNLKKKLAEHIKEGMATSAYVMDRSSFAQQIFKRYIFTAEFFSKELGVDFQGYLRNHDEFKKLNRTLAKSKTDTNTLEKFESLRLNKPDASSNSIEDISTQMIRQRFMVRPIYQRNEVINKNKSSSIIESILLGIKLPPIFVYKREDGISEVVDGQQRLLSILGFIGKDYLDENKNIVKSDKKNFSLNLKNGILKELDRKKFSSLSESLKNRILDYDLWMIEINQKNNPDFDPIDLFIRLNFKPYPIKENTFEMWNSYVDRKIIDLIKRIFEKHNSWFYLRKNNSRMENEGLIMSLVYLEYKASQIDKTFPNTLSFFDVYKVVDKINIRLKSKTDITKTLENPSYLASILQVCNDFETTFLMKVKTLVQESSNIENLNDLFNNLLSTERSIRTNQSFYTLWMLLTHTSIEAIKKYRALMKEDIKKVFNIINNVQSKEQFIDLLESFWKKYV